ncbi:MAG: LysM peptidoglycan-binding domain-containing protein [Gammaproteobacteria bacterium]|nr:MAG: LysM peptidoglycan-binding domain-containing protein [Gammaproteobacteria bacterium]
MAIVWRMRMRKVIERAATLLVLWCLMTLQALAQDWVYVTRPGDTLPKLAERFLAPGIGWHELALHNNLQRREALKAGKRLSIPLKWLRRQPAPAVAGKISGEAWLRPSGQNRFIRLVPDQKIGVGDEVRVGSGRVEIRFADSSRLELEANSSVIFNTLSTFANTGMVDTRLRLNKGRTRSQVTPLGQPGGRYEIATPNAVAAVRGTDFRLAQTRGQTQLAVEEGVVQLTANGVTHQVPAGNGMTVGQSGASTFTLLPAPRADIPPVFDSLPVELSWTAVAGARAYRAVIIADDETGTLHYDARLRTARARIEDLPNGRYILEVRALDSQEIEGLPIRAVFEVRRAAAPANLVAPQASATFRDVLPVFQWEVPEPGLLASLELARDPEFREVVATTPFALDSQARPPDIPAGRYYWRVVTLAGEDAVAISEARDLTLIRALPAPRIIAVNYFEDTVKLFWRKVQGASGYVLELARDELFRHIVRQDELSQPYASLRLPLNEVFYARVRARGSDYADEALSEPVRIRVPPEAS